MTTAHTTARPWKTVVVDVTRPLPAVPLEGADRLHVVVLRDGRPVGRFMVPAPIDPHPASLLRDQIAEHLAGDLATAGVTALVEEPTAPVGLTASVLICTRDRPDDLERCLASVALLDADIAEVVVVDNGSRSPRTREVVERAGARYVLEPHPGLDRARNRGFLEAITDVVLCTDDDVEVDRDWARRLMGRFEDPLVMAVTGLVLPAVLDTPARQRFETHASFVRTMRPFVLDGSIEAPTTAGRAGAGASMAFRTGFVRSVGGFPEELDAGMPTESGGDTYLVYRVLRAGYRVAYEPRALAFHHHRNDDTALERVVSGYGTGVYSYLAHALVTDRDPSAAVAAVRYAFDRLVREPARTATRRAGATPFRLIAAEAVGSARAPRAYARARRLVAGRPQLPIRSTEPLAVSAVAPGARRDEEPPSREDGRWPTMSVVVPTRGRRESVVELVRALDEQIYPDDRIQIVVVLDGDVDGSAAALHAAAPRRAVDVVTLFPPDPARGFGAAAARNAGVEKATGDVLLFLDDDVRPVTDSVLLAHAERHRDSATPLAVVGPCPPSRWGIEDAHGALVRNWWVDQVRALSEGRPLGFADVLTGNLSLRRDLFQDMGGFRPIARREDWELGYRLMRRGVAITAAPDAVVLHDADLDLRNAISDRRSEGLGDVSLATEHPGLGRLLPIASWTTMDRKMRRTVRGLFADPDAEDRRLAAAPGRLAAWERSGLRGRWAAEHGRTTSVAYWAGVAAAVGSEAALLALLAPASWSGRGDQLVVDLERLAATVPATLPPGIESVQVVAGGEPLGTASLALGGFPWRREVFERRLAEQFAGAAVALRARRLIP